MSEIDQNAARATLEAERARLAEQMSNLDVNDEDDDYDDNFADSAQVSAEQGEARALFAALQSELADVETALQRLDEGSYGSCETCGKKISTERLEALPFTRRCIDCAS